MTDDVGLFKMTGLGQAVDALKRIFAEVQAQEPALYAALGTARMLRCRGIRTTDGSISPYFSSHAWGTAVDLKITGQLDSDDGVLPSHRV